MVIGPVITTIGKNIVRYASRYYKIEGQAFNKLYTGFPRSKTIGRGVRHGLTAGSVLGSLISDDNGLNGGNGFQKKIQPVSPSYTSYKTRNRRPKRCYPKRS